jgi:hypothetical protein
MDKPIKKIEEKSENTFHLLPKTEQFAQLQRYRDLRHNEDFFVGQVLDNNLSKEWMDSILNGKP